MAANPITTAWKLLLVAGLLDLVFVNVPATFARILCILAIMGGILGLKLLHGSSTPGP